MRVPSHSDRWWFFATACVCTVALIVGGVSLLVPYQRAKEVTEARLCASSHALAALIDAVYVFDARFSHNFPAGTWAATLSQVRDALNHVERFAWVNDEVLVAMLHDDEVYYLVPEDPVGKAPPPVLSVSEKVAEPMARALRGESGSMVGADYAGSDVIAGYAYAPESGLGIVLKVELSAVRYPFMRAGSIAAGLALLAVAGIVVLYQAFGGRLVQEMHSTARAEAELALALRGTPVMVFHQDEELCYTGCHNLPGVVATDIIGKSEAQVWPAAEAQQLLRIKRAVLDTGSSTHSDVTLTINGVARRYQLMVEPRRDEDGRIVGIDSVAHVVTELVMSLEALRGMSRRVLSAADRERRGLARELHDQLGQVLTGVRYLLSGTPGEEQLAVARRELTRLLETVRSISIDLSPPRLAAEGLQGALHSAIERFESRFDIDIRFDYRVEGDLPQEVEETAFRIVQESLTNIARHAQASRIEVRLGIADGVLTVLVEDDGVGFDPSEASADDASLGLQLMNERVALLDGVLSIESWPGRGTRMSATMRAGAPTST